MTTPEHATQAAPERSLWATRVLWAALGSGVTAVLMSQGSEEPQARPGPVEVASVQAGEVAATASDHGSSGGDDRPLDVPGVAASSTGSELDPGSTTLDDPTSTSTGAPEPAAAEAPPLAEIPLPRMPGARVMSRGQRKDDEHGDWVLRLALSIPAPGTQVESFYRSALAEAGLAVSGGSREPGSLGTGHRASLQGRSRHASVQINVQQRAGTLRSVVRIFWRVR